jgi:hypothetical protein
MGAQFHFCAPTWQAEGLRAPIARGADVLFAVAGGAGILVGPEVEVDVADSTQLLRPECLRE